jgi:hypothetical protein
MRFSIRDLLWATALVALGLAWWLDNQTKHAAVDQSHRLHRSLTVARQWHHYIRNMHLTGFLATPSAPLDWAPLDEPLVEP